jgi:hypothetical protein
LAPGPHAWSPGETRDTNWRAAQLTLKRYGEKALKESAARTDELALAAIEPPRGYGRD